MKLTPAQRRALIAARDYGHAFAKYGVRSRSGGAYGLMCDRLVTLGLLTRPPYQITPAGRSALEDKP